MLLFITFSLNASQYTCYEIFMSFVQLYRTKLIFHIKQLSMENVTECIFPLNVAENVTTSVHMKEYIYISIESLLLTCVYV